MQRINSHLGKKQGKRTLCVAAMVALASAAFLPVSTTPARADFNGTTELSVLRSLPSPVLRRLKGGTPDEQGFVGENKGGFKGAEYQRGGADTLIVGIATSDDSMIHEGFRVADATFANQQPDGSFGDKAPTGAAFWIADFSRALLVLRESQYFNAYQDRFNGYLPHINAAIQYLHDNRKQLFDHDHHTPNRLFLDMDAFALASQLPGVTRDSGDIDYFRNEGLKLYDPDQGIFNESGGGDSSYQAVNVLNLMYYKLHDPGANAVSDDVLRKAMAWEKTKVEPDGTVSVLGNSRTGVGKEMYFGKPKDVDYREVVETLGYFGAMYGDNEAQQDAVTVNSHKAEYK